MTQIGSNILNSSSPFSLSNRQFPNVSNKFVKKSMPHISAEPLGQWLKKNPAEFYYLEPKWDGERDYVSTIKQDTGILYNKHTTFYDELPLYLEKAIKSFTKGKKAILDSEFRTKKNDIHDFLSARAYKELNVTDGPLRIEAFDILNYDGYDLRKLPLTERKKILNKFFKSNKYIHIAPSVKVKTQSDINKIVKKLEKVDAEGYILKTSDGTYYDQWFKHKFKDSIDLAIIGIKKTDVYMKGGLPFAFLAGVYDKEQEGYIPIQTISAGFDNAQRSMLDIEINENKVFEDDDFIYTKPKKVVEVEFIKLTPALKLREPAVVRIRNDKGPKQCKPEQLLELAEK